MSRPPALWVVDPSVKTREDQGVAEILREWPGDSRVFRPALEAGDAPGAREYAADGVVVMGSAASVHDSHPWIANLARWLTPLVAGERPIPLLGICFGHQLIAHLAGGTVTYVDGRRSKTVGVLHTRLEGSALLPGNHELRVVLSHREHVARPPQGYRVVATRPAIPVDGFEHETLPIFGFQFHPEAREQFAQNAGLDPAEIDERVREDSQRLLGAFRQRVLAGRSEA